MIKAIIFDLDGVLVDATEWHFEALNRALNIFGFNITREEHDTIFNGKPTIEKLKILSAQSNFPTSLHSIIAKLKLKFTQEKIRESCRPNHAKQLMLKYLKSKKYKMGVASNAKKSSVLEMLQMAQIDNYFQEIIGNDEGFVPKPAPDMYLEMFKRLKIKPHEAIIIEDSPVGIEAARKSGAKVFTVSGYNEVDIRLIEKL
jgi:HAD superfamily hydrolase (TIGR01509 family)